MAGVRRRHGEYALAALACLRLGDQHSAALPSLRALLYATDLTGLPSTLIVTAEHDPLRDEGEAYAERLHSAGVHVQLRRESGLIRNFMMLDELSAPCAAAAYRVAADLHARLHP